MRSSRRRCTFSMIALWRSSSSAMRRSDRQSLWACLKALFGIVALMHRSERPSLVACPETAIGIAGGPTSRERTAGRRASLSATIGGGVIAGGGSAARSGSAARGGSAAAGASTAGGGSTAVAKRRGSLSGAGPSTPGRPIAQIAASVRLCTPSFRRIALTCTLTVESAMPSSLAMTCWDGRRSGRSGCVAPEPIAGPGSHPGADSTSTPRCDRISPAGCSTGTTFRPASPVRAISELWLSKRLSENRHWRRLGTTWRCRRSSRYRPGGRPGPPDSVA
jgi:hypothetical protein